MAIENPSFADAGRERGSARAWLLRSRVAREAIAAFDLRGEESFELWRAITSEVVDDVRSRAFFADAGAEAFELGWMRSRYVGDLDASMLARAVVSSDGVEAFEWSALTSDWTLARASAPSLDTFDAGWPGASSFEPRFDSVASAPAAFEMGLTAERFDRDWPPLGRS